MALITGSNASDNGTSGLGNLIGGAFEDDEIFGLAGDDFLDGNIGNASIGIGNDFLDGGAGNDTLVGRDGIDILNGGAGIDSLDGGTENDFLNGGNDNDFLDGGLNNDNLDGGDGNDTLDGGDGNDILIGGDGNDSLFGDVGADTLIGGDGNDILIGSFGFDFYDGGKGNDTYQVGAGDIVVEAANSGTDTVISAGVSFTLGDNLENLEVIGDTGTGNNLNNKILIRFGDGIANGLGGNDTLTVGGGSGVLNGGSGRDTLTGGSRIDNLIGGTDDDLLIGGLGNDRLIGDAGKDRFRFNAPNEGSDFLTDFVAVDDSIQVSASGFGGGLTAGSAITADQFRLGSSALDASDRFIYKSSSGLLFFDVDGVGGTAQVLIADLIGGPTISNVDIVVV